MAEMDINATYKQWLMKRTKKELVDMIVGTDEFPPVSLNGQPKWNRTHILWGLWKTAPFDIDGDMLEKWLNDSIQKVGDAKGFILKYDYLRFDIRKPSFYIALVILILAVWKVVGLIISLFKWILM